MRAAWQPTNLMLPAEGSRAISLPLVFDTAVINVDIREEMLTGKIEGIQSVYIDNKDGTAAVDLRFYGAPEPFDVRALPYSQGWYAVAWPTGAAAFRASGLQGTTAQIVLSNAPMPYVSSAPVDGVLSTPALANVALNHLYAAAGEFLLVPAVALQTVRLYRGMFIADSPCNLEFRNGAGGAVLFYAGPITVGGSLTFQASGVPWMNATTAGNGLYLYADAAVTIKGGFGYVQS